MADRYWVGGSGSWNSTTKWSATSGGASGASVPTAVDNAIFNANSGTAHFTVTVTANATCANLTITPEPATGVTIFSVNNGFNITGTFSTSGTLGNRRIRFQSDTYGLLRNMQIATIGSVSDVDFQFIRITGTGGTLSGNRIGDFGGNKNIIFSTPKTVYWTTLAGGSWSGNNWANSSGGGVSTDNFPLAQDTAIIENTGLNASATITLDSVLPYCGTIDMSSRTNAMTLSGTTAYTIYGSWKFGSGVTRSYSGSLTFSGTGTQLIASAGKSFAQAITINKYYGSVELDSAFSSTSTITVTNGIFDSKNYSITASQFGSSNTNVRTVKFGSSTLTLTGSSPLVFTTSRNLTFDAGTSQINCSGAASFSGGFLSFYNISYTSTTAQTYSLEGVSSCNNFTITAPASAGISTLLCNSSQTIITGTLTVAGASPIRRIFVRSNTFGSTRTLNVNTLSATDCDFRDITITGAAAGTAPTRAGDCGGNSGITFPAAKTVYWNLSGSQNWSATAWATGSGGTPNIDNFPLAQDTAVFDNTGVVNTVIINSGWNTGTIDASAKTGTMSFSVSASFNVYGNWILRSNVITSGTFSATFSNRGTSTITSSGIQFTFPIFIDSLIGTVQLQDALTITTGGSLTINSGIFDAVSYNVTSSGAITLSGATSTTVKMGSGTWTLSGTGTVWDVTTTTNLVFYKNTANIVLSSTSTSSRTFNGGGLSYNKLTIGGTTGISTLTITGNNQFTELASTKTVAHTIALGSTTQTFGKWTVTGTVGNVVTLTGSGANHMLVGEATSGINYLAMGSIGFSTSSPAEFFAGDNSTGNRGAPVYRSARPPARTLYYNSLGTNRNWVGGDWSLTQNGLPGTNDPYSIDDVIFHATSNSQVGGLPYTVTINGIARCNKLTISAPTTGTFTLAGSSALMVHDDISLPAAGFTMSYSGTLTLAGTGAGKTFTTNGVTLSGGITVNGVASEWTLGSALNIGTGSVLVINGLFDLNNYNLTAGSIEANNSNSKTITFGSGTITLSGAPGINFGTTENNRANLTINTGTSQITCSNTSPTFSGNNQTFYNVAFTSTSAGIVTINGLNSFNNLSFTGITSTGYKSISVSANQTITGTMTLSAGTNATMRHILRSNQGVTSPRTLTCGTISITDVDFLGITISGAAAPAAGTRIGDCSGNSGITFSTPKTVYWNLAGNNNWAATAWATSSGGTPNINNFPLPQDTCIFEATSPGSGATITLNQSYNIGSIDMSARTTNTLTLATGTTQPNIYGNWINGTGTSISGTGALVFSGSSNNTITSAGKTFTQRFVIDKLSGSITLQDALSINNSSTQLILSSGTFNANIYNVSLLNTGSNGAFNSTGTVSRTLGIGSGTWTINSSGISWTTFDSTNLTITGTGTLSFNSTSSKDFVGFVNGPASNTTLYSDITLNTATQGTLNILGNNTLKDITNTYTTFSANIAFEQNNTTRVKKFSAKGSLNKLLNLTQYNTGGAPPNLIFEGTTIPNLSYLSITNIRAYPLTETWYADTTSVNNGSLGWLFESLPSSGFFLIF